MPGKSSETFPESESGKLIFRVFPPDPWREELHGSPSGGEIPEGLWTPAFPAGGTPMLMGSTA